MVGEQTMERRRVPATTGRSSTLPGVKGAQPVSEMPAPPATPAPVKVSRLEQLEKEKNQLKKDIGQDEASKQREKTITEPRRSQLPKTLPSVQGRRALPPSSITAKDLVISNSGISDYNPSPDEISSTELKQPSSEYRSARGRFNLPPINEGAATPPPSIPTITVTRAETPPRTMEPPSSTASREIPVAEERNEPSTVPVITITPSPESNVAREEVPLKTILSNLPIETPAIPENQQGSMYSAPVTPAAITKVVKPTKNLEETTEPGESSAKEETIKEEAIKEGAVKEEPEQQPATRVLPRTLPRIQRRPGSIPPPSNFTSKDVQDVNFSPEKIDSAQLLEDRREKIKSERERLLLKISSAMHAGDGNKIGSSTLAEQKLSDINKKILEKTQEARGAKTKLQREKSDLNFSLKNLQGLTTEKRVKKSQLETRKVKAEVLDEKKSELEKEIEEKKRRLKIAEKEFLKASKELKTQKALKDKIEPAFKELSLISQKNIDTLRTEKNESKKNLKRAIISNKKIQGSEKSELEKKGSEVKLKEATVSYLETKLKIANAVNEINKYVKAGALLQGESEEELEKAKIALDKAKKELKEAEIALNKGELKSAKDKEQQNLSTSEEERNITLTALVPEEGEEEEEEIAETLPQMGSKPQFLKKEPQRVSFSMPQSDYMKYHQQKDPASEIKTIEDRLRSKEQELSALEKKVEENNKKIKERILKKEEVEEKRWKEEQKTREIEKQKLIEEIRKMKMKLQEQKGREQQQKLEKEKHIQTTKEALKAPIPIASPRSMAFNAPTTPKVRNIRVAQKPSGKGV